MFGKLKEKLKSWLSKNKKVVEETPKEEKPTKEKKARVKKEKKKTPIPKPTKEEAIEPSKEEATKDILEESLEETIKAPVDSGGFFSRFKKRLTNERFDELFEELEMILLQNNVAYSAVAAIRESLAQKLIGKNPKDVNLSEELKSSIEELLLDPPNFIKTIKDSLKEKSPFVILFAGINGSGKTTTIAKVANLLQKNKLTVCLAAADTFRAASIEQIQQHADKLKINLIKKDYGSDPASVGFDAIQYAKKHHINVVLIDTAGRMQNKDSLMREMEKIVRVNKPDMKIFLGESITGNDATEQAKAFDDSINIDGIILSKADVDEKGGTAISVSQVTGKPILFLGVGQSYDDLEIFKKEKLIEKLGL
ncbi:MAG: signal recognition particle-docking protein FtsY [archaeon]|nr:signal recognition particle-docking protein FtsY [archaeon]MCR4323899.1 signal recognition particle-docking protein FtsY [Nanoarchaeota archaeon]